MTQETRMTKMARFLSLMLACLVLATFCLGLGCGASQRQAQTVAASVLATTANDALPALTAAYQAEGDRAIDAAPTQDEARKARDAVRAKWAPVWRAWDAVRAAHNAWATALESGTAQDVSRTAGALQAAYCGIRAAAPSVALPEVPGFGCAP